MESSELLCEFETLICDFDGLLGLLEDTLEANFEAKRVLCTLFQVSAEL